MESLNYSPANAGLCYLKQSTMSEKTDYHYLRFSRKGMSNNFSVIVADRKTGLQRSITMKAALKLHLSGSLHNKRMGNYFTVDLEAYNETVEYLMGIKNGWKVKHKNDSYYTIKGAAKGKQFIISTSALRKFFPELL